MSVRPLRSRHRRAVGPSWWLGTLGLVVIAGYFLVSEHRAHFLGVLPWLLLLACPLLHLLMHSSHAQGHRSGGVESSSRTVRPEAGDGEEAPD